MEEFIWKFYYLWLICYFILKATENASLQEWQHLKILPSTGGLPAASEHNYALRLLNKTTTATTNF